MLARNSVRGVTAQLPDQRRAARSSAGTRRWNGGETFGEGYDTYYGIRRGVVRGTEPGDSVEVWFTGTRPRPQG